MVECRCPGMLMQLLRQVHDFESDTTECIQKYPDDAPTHHWLKSSAININQLISTTLIQLARMEGFVDDDNQIVAR